MGIICPPVVGIGLIETANLEWAKAHPAHLRKASPDVVSNVVMFKSAIVERNEEKPEFRNFENFRYHICQGDLSMSIDIKSICDYLEGPGH